MLSSYSVGYLSSMDYMILLEFLNNIRRPRAFIRIKLVKHLQAINYPSVMFRGTDVDAC